jgi:NAD(P)-dependent dehydrogenase (short-subunit alcohol dehydrogenase family)
MSEEVWNAQVYFNLKSLFLACKHVLPVMEKQGGGAIVNIASTSGLRFTGNAQVGYAATQAGVIQLSRVVAVQYAPKGIRVNTVVPGQLHTPMVEARLARQRAGGDVKELLRQRQKRIPLGIEATGGTGSGRSCSRACSSSWWSSSWFFSSPRRVYGQARGSAIRCAPGRVAAARTGR